MRLRGRAKREATLEQRAQKRDRRRRVGDADRLYGFYLEHADHPKWDGNVRPEYWMFYAWTRGWAPRRPTTLPPNLTMLEHLQIVWPQHRIYDALLGTSPFLGLVARESE